MYLILNLLFSLALSQDPESWQSFKQLCSDRGYSFEGYQVVTDDGYILSLFRIPGKIDEDLSVPKPIVYVQPGIVTYSDLMILNTPDSLGLMLVDEGFDVWFGNPRGSYHSKRHIDPSFQGTKDYWQFTWQHMASLDVPANLNFILDYTGQPSLACIANSQGTLVLLALLAEFPDYSNIINAVITLGPQATILQKGNFLAQALSNDDLFRLADEKGVYEFSLEGDENEWLRDLINNNETISQAFESFCGVVGEGLAPDVPMHCSTSMLNFKHWRQMSKYDTHKVQKYDYGVEENLVKYRTEEPYIYSFSQVNAPVALFGGDSDQISDPEDVRWLEEQLLKSMVFFKSMQGFTDHDFLWSGGNRMQYIRRYVFPILHQYQVQIEEISVLVVNA